MSEAGTRMTGADEGRVRVLGWRGDKSNNGGILTVKDHKRHTRQKASQGEAWLQALEDA